MEINIPFNKWSRDKLKKLVKTATSRNKKYGDVGDTFTVDGTVYELTAVCKVSLASIRDVCWDVEGCKSPEEFVQVWKSIHPRKGWDPDQKVWFHRFKKVEEAKG